MISKLPFASMASTIFFSLLILFTSLSLASSESQYTLPEYYFINCGSNYGIDFIGRHFVGDENPSTFRVSGDDSFPVKNTNNPVRDIYQTARVFTQKSRYKLQADGNNTSFMLRFHFTAFSSNGLQLSNSTFDVSVSGFSLLSNFNVVDKAAVVKEFIIPIGTERNFTIHFTPSGDSEYAFVNAFEAFTAPSDLLPEDARFHISPTTGDTVNYFEKLATDYAFNPIHRINVSGNPINTTGDTSRRNWVPDDSFILPNETSTNITLGLGSHINHAKSGAAPYHAPDAVYGTARLLTADSVYVTWNFQVDKNRMYFLQAHFCDITNNSLPDQSDAFNFFIYSCYSDKVEPVKRVGEKQVPFFDDFVLDSGESGFVNLSIGAIRDNDQPVFMNGVEIMELLKDSQVIVELQNAGKKSKSVYVLAGCILRGLALFSVLLVSGF